MKTVEQLQDCIKQSKERIEDLIRRGEAIQSKRPYTEVEARALKGVFKDIDKEQDHIAELRQSIVYIETTPKEGIEASFAQTAATLKAIENELAQYPDKEVKKEIRSNRSYSEVKTQFKRLQFLMS